MLILKDAPLEGEGSPQNNDSCILENYQLTGFIWM